MFLALQSFLELVAGRYVTRMCDNSMVVAYINKQGGTVSRSLCSLAKQLLRWMESLDVHLNARYLPGQSNALADLLSRWDQVIGTEWSLHPRVARDLLRRWGLPSIDLFATSYNTKLPLYCSLFPDPQAVFEDAFRHPYDNLDLYTFPPFPLVGRVVARVRETPNFSMIGRPPLARKGLVRRLTPTDPTTSDVSMVGPVVAAVPLQQVPQRRPPAEPSRVATLQRLLRESGFSRGSAVEMSGCVRTSTSRLYQVKWMLFCGWCLGRDVAPVIATVPLIVDFLVHLRRDKSLSVSAFKGRRSALNSVFALKVMDLADSHPISIWIRSFLKSVRPEELRPVAWVVTLILQGLTQAPYEPLRTSDERFLAQKTLFLLALASAKRIGELRALSHCISHSRGWGEVSFTFVAGFVAKTQDPSSSAPRFEGFTAPALPNASTNRNEKLLCPVWAVRCYLFVTARRSTKEIAKNTVSFWLRKTISRVYQLLGRSVPDPSSRAWETRGIAPSLRFKKNFAVDQVLKAGTWRRHITFTRHYLRDLVHRSLETFHLGPVVAAQALV